MGQVSINSINGTPPYSIFICDYNQYTCELIQIVNNTVPPTINITVPERYNNYPIFVIKIVDSLNCEFVKEYNCQTLTPTPSFTNTPSITPSNTATPTNTTTQTPSPNTQTPTPTNTSTPSLTPTNTTTTSVTPTNTKTQTQTPTITPTVTPTNTTTVTPTFTPYASPTQTPSFTPTVSLTPSPFIGENFPYNFLIFVEPLTGATELANYLYSVNSATTFFGFSNGTPLSSDPETFNQQIGDYLGFPGFINQLSGFKIFFNQDYDNRILNGQYDSNRNFDLTEIPADSVPTDAWYSIIIWTGFTLTKFQSLIGVGINQGETLTPINMNPDYYNLTFNFGSLSSVSFPQGSFRLYTTFPSTDLLLNNTNQNIYFKGLGLTS